MSVSKAQQVVADLGALFGFHKGCRAVHAKGLVVSGEFTATPAAARLTRAAHMQGRPVPVIARFSNGNGNPAAPDFLPDVRGLAVSFQLPDGQRTDLVAALLPRFPLRTPEAVAAFTDALRPRLTLPLRLFGFLLRHPEFFRSVPANALALRRPPASYGSIRYFAIHAYKWTTPYGSERFVRYRWVPEQERRISWLRALIRGPDYLQNDLRSRLRNGSLRMHLQVQIARPGDPVDDPTAVWPDDREVVTVGTLELRAIAEQAEDCVFDPLRLTEGIGASRDPILQFRTQAYAVSAGRRGVAHRPQHLKPAPLAAAR